MWAEESCWREWEGAVQQGRCKAEQCRLERRPEFLHDDFSRRVTGIHPPMCANRQGWHDVASRPSPTRASSAAGNLGRTDAAPRRHSLVLSNSERRIVCAVSTASWIRTTAAECHRSSPLQRVRGGPPSPSGTPAARPRAPIIHLRTARHEFFHRPLRLAAVILPRVIMRARKPVSESKSAPR